MERFTRIAVALMLILILKSFAECVWYYCEIVKLSS